MGRVGAVATKSVGFESGLCAFREALCSRTRAGPCEKCEKWTPRNRRVGVSLLGEGVRKMRIVRNRAHFRRPSAQAKTLKNRAKKRAKSAKNERVKSDVIEYLCSIMSSTPVFGRWLVGGVDFSGPSPQRGGRSGLPSFVFCLLSLKDTPSGGDKYTERRSGKVLRYGSGRNRSGAARSNPAWSGPVWSGVGDRSGSERSG